MTIQIVVADDHPIFRDGLVKSLEETNEFKVVGVASSASEAVDVTQRERPDIALLDLSMPGNGLTAVEQIFLAGFAKNIAMLTVSEDEDHVAEALRVGAKGYILKGVSADELRKILKDIMNGESHVSPTLAARLLTARKTNRISEKPLLEELTKREEDILRRVAKGMSNKEVARELDIQEKTVKHYMTTILSKLHARNRVEAAIIAHTHLLDN